MSQISRNPLKKKTEEKLLKIFFKTIDDLRGEEGVEKFFGDLLTPTEKVMLSKRLGIAVLLTKGATYGEISEALNVTSGTINKISDWLKLGGEGFGKSVELIIRKEKSDRSWRDLMGIFMGETFPVKGRRGSSAANSVRDREIESLPSRL